MIPERFEPGTRIAILGAGVEGQAVLAYLMELGCLDLTVCDKDESVAVPPGVKTRLGDEYLADLQQFEVIFRSPGVPRDLAGLIDAESAGVQITSATREFFARCPCTIVGITGSNGKTTTTALIASVLTRLYGDNVHVGGNDRAPLLDRLNRIQRDHVVVLELSSFQLQDLEQSPHVAVVLNITANHLDVHPSFDDYLRAKSQIARHQTPADFAVLNWAFTRVRELAQLTEAHVVWTNHAEAEEGAYLKEGKIALRHGGVEEYLMAVSALPLVTNVDNVLAAAAVGKLFGIATDVIRQVILGFRGISHRLELVRELDGVRYYDDSASTTPESTENALRSFAEAKVVLIVGGSDKQLSYDVLGKEIVRTQTRAVAIGQTREKIANAIRGAALRFKAEPQIEVVDRLEDAVQTARRMARPGDVVVLSPACASFDMFRNAKQRGEQFQTLVRALR